MKRKVLWTIVVALWAALVACYWRAYVPLTPLASIPFANNIEPVGFTTEGDIVVCPTLNWSEPLSNDPNFGPVQVWRFPEGRLVREFFTPDHVVQIGDFLKTGEVSGVRDGEWSLLNVSNGKTVERIPVTGVVDGSRRIPGSSLLVYSEDNFVRCFDTDRDTLLWSAEGFRNIHRTGPDFVVVGKAIREPQGWTSGGEVPLSLKDGQPLSRFDHLGPISWLVPSPDGRLAAAYLTRQKKFAMCDALTGQVRWTATVPLPPNGYRFEEDGRIFQIGGRERNRNFVVQRWNVDDGTPLEVEVTHRAGEPRRSTGTQHRIVLESEDSSVGIEATIRRALSKTPFASLAPPFLNRTWVVDVATSKSLGIISTGRRHILRTPNEQAIMVFAGKHVDYFELPPTRNWRWLILWSLVPPALCWLLLKAIGRLRRPRPAN